AAVFYSKPVSKGGGSGGHYGGNPETYMNVGEGMGKAMVDLLSK
ncbi:MAG: sialate O-acetylesterase, partial [Verrucomicrobia bacterium]|nr:sialate O-acetylesterase [Verrucomicrobiota bacterium]